MLEAIESLLEAPGTLPLLLLLEIDSPEDEIVIMVLEDDDGAITLEEDIALLEDSSVPELEAISALLLPPLDALPSVIWPLLLDE